MVLRGILTLEWDQARHVEKTKSAETLVLDVRNFRVYVCMLVFVKPPRLLQHVHRVDTALGQNLAHLRDVGRGDIYKPNKTGEKHEKVKNSSHAQQHAVRIIAANISPHFLAQLLAMY